MKNIDKIRKMSSSELAVRLCVDEYGQITGVCSICAKSNYCDDNCVKGVQDWLESEIGSGCN